MAGECFGWPSRRFIRRVVRWQAKDPQGLRSWFDERRRYYLKRAEEIEGPGHQLNRIHQKFATLYAAGCLAIKFGILPWKGKVLRKALLKCERDHVKLVAEHSAGTASHAQTPFDRLLAYIRTNQHRFLDLGRVAAGEPVGDQDAKYGYRKDHKGQLEFLFSEQLFKEIVGGKGPANFLKPDLDSRGLIAATEAGQQRKKYVVRRHLDSEKKKQKGAET